MGAKKKKGNDKKNKVWSSHYHSYSKLTLLLRITITINSLERSRKGTSETTTWRIRSLCKAGIQVIELEVYELYHEVQRRYTHLFDKEIVEGKAWSNG